jgi:hypothetical protein
MLVDAAWPAGASVARSSDAHPRFPRVEWLVAPVGIDTLQPRFTWLIAASRSRNLRQTACRVLVASSRQQLKRGHGDIWDSGRHDTTDLRLRPDVRLPLCSQTQYWWAVMVWDGSGRPSPWSSPAPFVTGIVAPNDWQGRWIAATRDRAAEQLPPPAIGTRQTVDAEPLPIFRRRFDLARRVRFAAVCVSGLGHYELLVNGRPACASVLNPGWTNYRETVFYNTFDVTKLLRRGRNVLGVMLGNGMYNVENYAGRYTKFVGSFGQPKLILQLRIVFDDGSETTLGSDLAWQTRPGPIVLSSPYNEDFDARKASPNWTRERDGGWAGVFLVDGPGGKLRAQNIPGVGEAATFRPVTVTQPTPGVFVYDLGQNFAGWPKITVRGRAGTTVKLTPGELLAEDGQVSQANIVGRPGIEACYNYTLRGGGAERWHPRFSYFGFRYLQVEGAAPPKAARKGQAVLLSLEGVFLHTALRQTGVFRCSDGLFERIHRLIKYALLSNTFSVLTDCPQREKLGWLEQTYLNADTVFYNQDAITLYEKIANDIVDSQRPDGMVSGIAPEYVAFVAKDGSNTIWRDSPEWGAAVVFSPMAAYRYSGDTFALSVAYPAMRRYARYLNSRMKNGLLGYGMGDWYDVGPKPPGPAQLTSLTLTATVSYYAMLRDMAAIATLLGENGDAVDYARQAEDVKRTINDLLFNKTSGGYDSDSQTANAMPLALGMVPSAWRPPVLANLVRDIRAHADHVTAGDVGFHYVVLALMENGRADVLYDMLSRTDKPSYGYQLARGATSLTEAWDANRHASQDHFMLGHAETWFYRGLAGINLDMGAAEGERIRIAPQIIPQIAGVSATYRSVLGDILCAWRWRGRAAEIFVAVPPGAQAKVVLPSDAAERIRESGRPLSSAEGVLHVVSDATQTTIAIGSGDYRFTVLML